MGTAVARRWRSGGLGPWEASCRGEPASWRTTPRLLLAPVLVCAKELVRVEHLTEQPFAEPRRERGVAPPIEMGPGPNSATRARTSRTPPAPRSNSEDAGAARHRSDEVCERAALSPFRHRLTAESVSTAEAPGEHTPRSHGGVRIAERESSTDDYWGNGAPGSIERRTARRPRRHQRHSWLGVRRLRRQMWRVRHRPKREQAPTVEPSKTPVFGSDDVAEFPRVARWPSREPQPVPSPLDGLSSSRWAAAARGFQTWRRALRAASGGRDEG
jgi:hypothetical protein